MECAHERVAQSVEHVTFNHGVVGSIPTALTNKINTLDLLALRADATSLSVAPNHYGIRKAIALATDR